MDEAMRDYLLSFDPVNETVSEPLMLVIDQDKMRQMVKEWVAWREREFLRWIDGPSGEGVNGA